MKIRLREDFLNEKYLEYFHKNNIKVTNIEFISEGLYSETYKIVTPKKEYALNVRDSISDNLYNLEINEDLSYTYLPKIYDVIKVNTKFCVIMELLSPIDIDKKNSIDCINYLFYLDNKSGIDEWLENNLNDDLYRKVVTLIQDNPIEEIPFKERIEDIKWFYKNYSSYEEMIEDIQSAFQEYYEVFNSTYSDFHSGNLMQDERGYIKLIDL
jgi:thiamine kinase-like enzyme